jgi:hypothetical protein
VDLAGKPYYQTEKQLQAGGVSIDLSAASLQSGVYLIKLQSQDGTSQVVRVVKR